MYRLKKLLPGLLLGLVLAVPSAAQTAADPATAVTPNPKVNGFLQRVMKAKRSRVSAMSKDVAVSPDASSVRVIVQVAEGTRKSDLEGIDPDIKIGTVIGTIATARLPLEKVNKLAEHYRVMGVGLSAKYKPLNNVARSSTTSGSDYLGILSTHGVSGLGVFDGTNVVVGVVDTGIDYKHEDFITGTGVSATSRILNLWDQTDNGGPGASPYGYGSEWTRTQMTNDIRNGTSIVRETDTQGHGTHVAGSAAGDGSSTNGSEPAGKYAGVATGSDLVIVKTDFTDAGICEGVEYIFTKAAALGRPAVVNLSLGGHWGPHDGSSTFETCIAALSGAGKIVVVAAGNEGADPFHASRTGTGTINFQKLGIGVEYVQFWHDPGDSFTLKLQSLDHPECGFQQATAGNIVFSTSANMCNVWVDIFNAPGANRNYTGGSGYLGSEIFVIIEDFSVSDPASYQFTFTRTASGGTGKVHGWIQLDTADNTFPSPDYGSTVGMPGTSANVITVGAFTSRTIFGGTLGDIASFSSKGPTRDNRVKPNIAAPGQALYSSFSTSYSNGGYPVAADGRHLAFQGTSMATPIVTGSVALLLQQLGNATTSQIMTKLQAVARTDTKTSGTPTSNTWGVGKLMATPPAYPAPATLTATALSNSSIRWGWDDISNEENYRIRRSSNSSIVAAVNQNTVTYDQTGLNTNSQYSIYLEAYNLAGTTTSVSKTAYTGAAVPASLAVTAVSSSTASVSWSVNGNPAGTPFELSVSSDAFVTHFSTPVAFSANNTGTSATVSNLSAATAYTFRLRARNGDQVATSFSATASTTTDPGPPALVTGLAATTQGISSITWTWNLQGIATNYNILNGANDLPLGSTTGNTFTRTGLLSNTTYGIKVGASNSTGQGGYGTAVSKYTHAEPPDNSFAALSVTSFSVTLDWDSTNPSGTEYQIERWTAGGSTTTSSTLVQGITITGLSASTTYFFRGKGRNGDGILSPESSAIISALTAPPAPAIPASLVGAALGTSSITWSWSAVATAASYKLYPSSGGPAISVSGTSQGQESLSVNTAYGARVTAVNATGESGQTPETTIYTAAAVPSAGSHCGGTATQLNMCWSANGNPSGTYYTAEAVAGTVASSSRTLNGSAQLIGLTPNTHYSLRVRAENGNGVATANYLSVTTPTLAQVPASLTLTALTSSTARADWSANGNPSDTQFELTLSTDSFGSVLATPLPFSTASNVTTKLIDSLSAGTTYQARVRARNKSNFTTAYVTASVTMAQNLTQTFSPGTGANLSFGGAVVVLPPDAFSTTVNMIIEAPASFPASNSFAAQVTGLGTGIEISNTQGLQPQKPVTLTLSYTTPLPAGVTPEQLVIARYDPARGVWLLLPTTPVAGTNQVTASVDHFSLFQVMGVAQPSAISGATINIYPNPVHPSQGETMKFTGLPTGTTVKIYTFRGDLVRSLTATGPIVTWDGKNGGGTYVASGVYLVHIKASSGSEIMKVMVER